MPKNLTIQNHIEQIALERGVSLGDARRIFIEEIDLAKRTRLTEGRVLPERGTGKTRTENPFRRHIEPGTPPVTKHNKMKTRNQQETAQRESVNSGEPRPTPTGRQPHPGTMTAIILGEINDPEKSFDQAYMSLKGMHRFDHLTDQQLRQRMREVGWRYNVAVSSRV